MGTLELRKEQLLDKIILPALREPFVTFMNGDQIIALTSNGIRVMGVEYSNDAEGEDGRTRQSVLKEMKLGEVCNLVREPDNPFDKRAIAVHFSGNKIGYIPKKVAALLAEELDRREFDLRGHITELGPNIYGVRQAKVRIGEYIKRV